MRRETNNDNEPEIRGSWGRVPFPRILSFAQLALRPVSVSTVTPFMASEDPMYDRDRIAAGHWAGRSRDWRRVKSRPDLGAKMASASCPENILYLCELLFCLVPGTTNLLARLSRDQSAIHHWTITRVDGYRIGDKLALGSD